jgi:CheY-like chemotaxis protein
MLQDIMLVDDSHDDAMLIRRSLTMAGLQNRIFHIHNSRDAIDYLSGKGKYADRRQCPLPDILLLDLKMPEVNGFELLKWARSQPHLSRLIIVVITRTDDPRLIQMCYQLGANSFLSKDGNSEEMKNFVHFFENYGRISGALPEPSRRKEDAA